MDIAANAVWKSFKSDVTINRKSNPSLYSLYYAVTCNEFAGLHLRVIAPEEYSSIRRNVAPVGNTVSDLTGPRFPAPEANTLNFNWKKVTATFCLAAIIKWLYLNDRF